MGSGTRSLAAAAALLLVGCGQHVEVDRMAGSRNVDDLRNVDWQLQSMETAGGAARALGDVDAVLRISADDRVSGHGCNFWGGAGDISSGSVRVTGIDSTLIGCSDIRAEVDDVTQELLTAGASWAIDDGTLELTGGGTRLTYRPRTTPWSNPEASTLVEGAFGDAIYRLAWQVDSDNRAIGVQWESRDEKGVGLGGSGIGRSSTEDITYLDPSGASVAGRGFVYVPAPLSIDRVVWSGPHGQVDLKRYDLPAARTWHLFAGFVDGPTKGGRTIGYSAGTETLRSRVLPY